MSSLSIERSFSVDAPPARVWDFLKDPSLVVTCLPGAALVSSSEDGLRHEGTVTVKLGTLSVSYRGTADFVEVDDAKRRLSVRAEGREKAGAGTAQMSMTSEVHEVGDGSEVEIEARVDVTGKLVSLGRGMIGVVSEQVVSDFATNLCRRVSAEPSVPEADSGAGGSAAATGTTAAGESGAEPDVGEPGTAGAPANALSILFRAIWARITRMFEPD